MTLNCHMQIEAAPLNYYSALDEASFFDWLGKIPSVRKFEGCGAALIIDINESLLDDESARELIALFFRFDVDMTPLGELAKLNGMDWICNPSSYWYHRIFLGEQVDGNSPLP